MFKIIRQEWKKYLIDILVIIIGISLSFLLDEWRQNLREKKVEIQALESIQNNLITDTTLLATRIKICDKFLWGYDQALTYESEEFPEDSLAIYFDYMLSYIGFNATDIGYEELKQTGHSSLISNKVLLNDIIRFYGNNVSLIKEWNDIDKQFILRDLIPYTMKKMPYTPPQGTFLFNNTADILQLMKTDNALKNHIKMNSAYKAVNKQVYISVLARMKALLTNITTEIEQLKS